jgi:hypothetical protein
MKHFVATTTWNSVDLVRLFLAHYRKLGFDAVFMMDFASTDGTEDILQSDEWRGFVERVPFPGVAGLDSSNVLLAAARERQGDDTWCLFCDPDELLVTPSMNVRDLVPYELEPAVESWQIRRFNVTAPLSIAERADHRLSADDALTLKIAGRHRRGAAETVGQAALDPPWIFTDIPGKVLVRLAAAIGVGDGDHVAHTVHDQSHLAPDGLYLLHYPFRTYEAFQSKIELARIGYGANPQLPASHGWQQRRWIRLADAGGLRGEYLQQFIADADIARQVSDGTLIYDHAVARFHRK